MKRLYRFFALTCVLAVFCGCGNEYPVQTDEQESGSVTEEATLDDMPEGTIPEDLSSEPFTEDASVETETLPQDEYVPYYYHMNGEDYELIDGFTDRAMYYRYEDLENNSDYIVVGEFVDDAVLKGSNSINTFEISKVIKGSIEGANISIAQRYEVKENTKQIIAHSELTPMEKGTFWICFLKRNEDDGLYWIVGDTSGRYPCIAIEEEKLMNQEYQPNELGVYHIEDFQYGIYKDAIKLIEDLP